MHIKDLVFCKTKSSHIIVSLIKFRSVSSIFIKSGAASVVVRSFHFTGQSLYVPTLTYCSEL